MNRSNDAMHITLQGTNLELTHELRKFVYKKLSDCRKALGDVDMDAVQIDIEVECTTNRHPLERRSGQRYRAEANIRVPGRFIRAEESAMHLEPAIVKMKNTLTRNIRHWREQMIKNRRDEARKAKRNEEAMAVSFAEPMFLPEDEWQEPPAPASPYQDLFDSDYAPHIWEGSREDERDYI